MDIGDLRGKNIHVFTIATSEVNADNQPDI